MALLRLAGDHRGRDNFLYFADGKLLAAANAALYLQVPLLLAGEPGCGKTDFAWYAAKALAHALGEPSPEDALPLECYIHSDSTATELLYHYDAMARFADAHDPGGRDERRDPRHHMELAPFGRALMSQRRQVVLIDEIDKAPRDLSNDLLRELDQGHFVIKEVPRSAKDTLPDPNNKASPLDGEIQLQRNMFRPLDPKKANKSTNQADKPRYRDKPMVIVTSNAERQLPEAFLRRCVYHYIDFPSEAALQNILNHRLPQAGQTDGDEALAPHVTPQLRTQAIQDGIALVAGLRGESKPLGKKPGTAEIIGWLKTLLALGSPTDLEKLSEMAAQRRAKGKANWLDVPGLHCLVKLKADLDLLRA